MKKSTNDRERRLQLRLEYLGTNNPRCIHCGQDDPFCLELHEPLYQPDLVADRRRNLGEVEGAATADIDAGSPVEKPDSVAVSAENSRHREDFISECR
jgi:hypothetical protein